MFLALKEIGHQKARYLAITAVVFLVSYLVYFLAGLAFGLAKSYTEFVDGLPGTQVTLTQAANKSAPASRIPTSALTDLPEDAGTVTLAAAAVEDRAAGDGSRINVFVAAVSENAAPALATGTWGSAPTDVVIDPSLTRAGWGVGDKLRLPDAEDDLTIVGVAKPTRFQAAPLILTLGRDLTGLVGRSATDVTSMIVTPAGTSMPSEVGGEELETVTTADFIDAMPGYRAQYLTFSLMIGALIVILSLVLGIFMYVLTIQKSHIFGVMKAQGIPTAYIARAGASQTLFISLAGIVVGMAAAVASGWALEDHVPFATSVPLFGVVTAAFIVFTLLGSLFPIRVIAKIDPMAAIG